MTWTAPDVERSEPYEVLPERAMLDAWLDYHRQTLLWKCAGLTADQLTLRATPPSTLSLLGLVRHMAGVERFWFRRNLLGEDIADMYDGDDEFDALGPADAEADFATFAAEVAVVRTAAASRSLDDTFRRRDATLSLRWIYVHMIEEYARHNGHADLIREAIDGRVGD